MANFQFVKFDDSSPADDTYDLHDAGLSDDFQIPVWMSFSYWVTTADVLAGAFNIDLSYIDPTGQTRAVNGSPISLADSTSIFTSPVFPIQRQSGTSLVEMVSTLLGGAGTALVSCRVKFSAETFENGGSSDWTLD